MIHIVGIGLDGVAGLSDPVKQLLTQATVLVGSDRHLSYFPHHPAQRLPLKDLTQTPILLRPYLPHPPSSTTIVILTSGDPLFFGLGRLLLEQFPAGWLTFHPHLSSVQLAFSRVKLPWQDAQVVSAHGRSLDELIRALQQGHEKIAVLTDGTNTPGAIVQLIDSLDLPVRYRRWVCENLGGEDERVTRLEEGANLSPPLFAPLNVVVLQRIDDAAEPLDMTVLPLLGLPDSSFLSFPDRPGLMTKREVRVQVLAELALQTAQVVWDIGAGTGSVSIEIARICPGSQVYAIEKTAIGASLIAKNCQRFQVGNVTPVQGMAPDALRELPAPDRIFIGGSGGNLTEILDFCAKRLSAGGQMVLALATFEHLTTALGWLGRQAESQKWGQRVLQVQLARSVPIAGLTRLAPLNPVTLLGVEKRLGSG